MTAISRPRTSLGPGAVRKRLGMVSRCPGGRRDLWEAELRNLATSTAPLSLIHISEPTRPEPI
eukprot:444923-Pyramimonas_sp.AAC.1